MWSVWTLEEQKERHMRNTWISVSTIRSRFTFYSDKFSPLLLIYLWQLIAYDDKYPVIKSCFMFVKYMWWYSDFPSEISHGCLFRVLVHISLLLFITSCIRAKFKFGKWAKLALLC